jgi:hypothetical protein
MWGTIFSSVLGAATAPVNVSAPNPDLYRVPTSPYVVLGAIAGVALLGGLAYSVLRR